MELGWWRNVLRRLSGFRMYRRWIFSEHFTYHCEEFFELKWFLEETGSVLHPDVPDGRGQGMIARENYSHFRVPGGNLRNQFRRVDGRQIHSC